MSTIGPVTDQYIDSIIKSAGVANPNLNKTQGTGMRELIKKLRDRLEQLSTAGYANSPDGIISGLVLSVSDGTVNVSPGIWKAGEIFLTNAIATFPLDAQDGSQSRYDVVYADNQGALGIVSGELNVDPTEPDIPENSTKVGSVLITPDDYTPSQAAYIGAGTCCTPLISHTYTELSTMVTGSSLVPGQKYLITDYQTVYNQPVTNIIMEGDVEPLVITAISTNEFDSKVTSINYPGDLIEYQFSGVNNGVTVKYTLDLSSITGDYNYIYDNLDDSFVLVLWNDTNVLSREYSTSLDDPFSAILPKNNGNLTLYVMAKMVNNTLKIAINGTVHTYEPGYDSMTDWFNSGGNTHNRDEMPGGDAAIVIGATNVIIQAFDNDNTQPAYTPIPNAVQLGWITKRTDPQHNEAPFDLRAVKFRRYKALLTDVPSMINGPSLATGNLVFGAYAPSTSNDWDRGIFVAGKNINNLVHNNNDGTYIKILSYDLISEENVLANTMRIGNNDLVIDDATFADYLCFTADGDTTNVQGRITSCKVSDSSIGLPNVVIRAFPEMKVTGANIGNDCIDATVYAYELAVSDIDVGYDTDAILVVDSQMVKIGYQSSGAIVSNSSVVSLLGASNDAASYGSNITLQPRSANNVLSGTNIDVDTQSTFNFIFNSIGIKIGSQSFNNRIYGSNAITLSPFNYYNDIFDSSEGSLAANNHSNIIHLTNSFKVGGNGNTITQNNGVTLGFNCSNNTLGADSADNVLEFSSGNTLGTNCLRNYLRNSSNQNLGNSYSNHTPWAP